MPSAGFLATLTGSLHLAASVLHCGATQVVPDEKQGFQIRDCCAAGDLPLFPLMGYKTKILRSKSFTAGKDPEYLLDRRA